MFRQKNILLLLPLCIFLYACPLESPVPLDEKPVQKIDTNLIGYWYGIIKDGSDFFGIEALEISKFSDSTYFITRYGKSIKDNIILPDTAHFTGYLSTLGEETFMNVATTIVEVIPRKKKEPEIKKTKAYYLAMIELHHDTLVVKTVTNEFAGLNPRFKNSTELRNILLSMKKENRNIYDDVYKLSYRKMIKPF